MANYKPPVNGLDKRPHDRGNGRNPLPKEIKEIRELAKKDFTGKYSNMLFMTKQQLRDIVASAETPLIQLGIAKGIIKWIETGDYRYIQPWTEYLLGKPREYKEHTIITPQFTKQDERL